MVPEKEDVLTIPTDTIESLNRYKPEKAVELLTHTYKYSFTLSEVGDKFSEVDYELDYHQYKCERCGSTVQVIFKPDPESDWKSFSLFGCVDTCDNTIMKRALR